MITELATCRPSHTPEIPLLRWGCAETDLSEFTCKVIVLLPHNGAEDKKASSSLAGHGCASRPPAKTKEDSDVRSTLLLHWVLVSDV